MESEFWWTIYITVLKSYNSLSWTVQLVIHYFSWTVFLLTTQGGCNWIEQLGSWPPCHTDTDSHIPPFIFDPRGWYSPLLTLVWSFEIQPKMPLELYAWCGAGILLPVTTPLGNASACSHSDTVITCSNIWNSWTCWRNYVTALQKFWFDQNRSISDTLKPAPMIHSASMSLLRSGCSFMYIWL